MNIPTPYLLVFIVVGFVVSLLLGPVGWILGLVSGWLLHDKF